MVKLFNYRIDRNFRGVGLGIFQWAKTIDKSQSLRP